MTTVGGREVRRAVLAVLLASLMAACGGSATSQGQPGVSPTPAAAGGDAAAYPEDQVAEGDKLYHQTCVTCHGQGAKGVQGLGKDLTTSQFFAESTDDELLEYVLVGRTIDDPANTTGVAMPPKGGFIFLQDEDILAIIAYLRTLQE